MLPKPWKTSVLPWGALLDHNDGGTIQKSLPGAVQQLKLLPRMNTSHFLPPRVYLSPYFNGPKANKKRTWLRTDLNLKNFTSRGQKYLEKLPTADRNWERWVWGKRNIWYHDQREWDHVLCQGRVTLDLVNHVKFVYGENVVSLLGICVLFRT